MLTNLHFFADKKGNNSIMHIGTIMIFGGILEGVWPINNQKKFLLCDFRCHSGADFHVFKSGSPWGMAIR